MDARTAAALADQRAAHERYQQYIRDCAAQADAEAAELAALGEEPEPWLDEDCFGGVER